MTTPGQLKAKENGGFGIDNESYDIDPDVWKLSGSYRLSTKRGSLKVHACPSVDFSSNEITGKNDSTNRTSPSGYTN